jgi:hypothetical protein
MTDLFEVVPYIACNRVTKTSCVTRPADRAEIVTYARWLADRAGLPSGLDASDVHCGGARQQQFGRGVTFGTVLKQANYVNGERCETQYEIGSYSVPFAGRDAHRDKVTLERLGEDGEVIAAQAMPARAEKGRNSLERDRCARRLRQGRKACQGAQR